MNFFERKNEYKRGGSGQNPTPSVSNGGIFGRDIYYGEPQEKPTPMPLPKPLIDKTTEEWTVMHKYNLSLNVDTGFARLYSDAINEILKRHKNHSTTYISSDGSIKIIMLACKHSKEAIVKDIQGTLDLEVMEVSQ